MPQRRIHQSTNAHIQSDLKSVYRFLSPQSHHTNPSKTQTQSAICTKDKKSNTIQNRKRLKTCRRQQSGRSSLRLAFWCWDASGAVHFLRWALFLFHNGWMCMEWREDDQVEKALIAQSHPKLGNHLSIEKRKLPLPQHFNPDHI